MNQEPKHIKAKPDEIVFSLTNPRRHGGDFTQRPDWPEFLDSVRQHGVKQWPLVRPLPASRTDAAAKGRKYELIAGDRRVTAAQALKLPEINLVLETMDDAKVVEIQQIENLQREDLSPLEEAQGYADWRDSLIKAGAAKTVEEAVAHICTKINRKRSAVFQKLALLRLHSPVREALIAGKIDPSVAGAIARVPGVAKQESILVKVLERNWNGEPLSFRQTEKLIEDEYAKSLKGGPFDKDAADLVPVTWLVRAGKAELLLECRRKPHFTHPATIGMPRIESKIIGEMIGSAVMTADGFEMAWPLSKKDAKTLADFLTNNAKAPGITVTQAFGGACVTCWHRSGVMDPDSKNPNVCTVPECFAKKVKAHWLKKAGELRLNGKEVLTPGELKKRGAHVRADQRVSAQNRYGDDWEEVMGKHKPTPVLVATPDGIKKFYPAKEAAAAAGKNGVKLYTQTKGETPEEKTKREEKEKAEEASFARRAALARSLIPELVKAADKIKAADAVELLAKEIESNPWEKDLKLILKSAKTDVGRVMLDQSWNRLEDAFSGNSICEPDSFAAWKALGVDLKARFEASEKALAAKAAVESKTAAENKAVKNIEKLKKGAKK